MSSSLRDQLLAAGLVSEKQAKQASQQQARQFKARSMPTTAEKLSAQAAAQAAKAARDQELSRQQQQKAERKARRAQVEQLVEQAALPKVDGDDFYSFVDDTKIRRLAVNATLRDQLMRGELAIVRYRGRYALVPAAAAARIRERDEQAVVPLNPTLAGADPNDPYKDFAVPDDLIW